MRHFYKLILFSFILLGLFSSCQKEINYDLSYDFKGQFACDFSRDISLSGEYMKGQAMNANNYVIINVNVLGRGVFSATSNTVNGVTFAGSGVFDEVGLQQIKMYASGTPTQSGTKNFTLTFYKKTGEENSAAGHCNLPVKFEKPAGSFALFTINDVAGTCDINPATDIHGLYMVDLPMTAQNTVTLHIDAITTGDYSITTPTRNGVYFSGEGTITTPGPQDIVLTAYGIPALENDNGSPWYYPTVDGGCSISMVFLPSVAPITNMSINCGSAFASGNYVQGIPMDATNYVLLDVTLPAGSVPGVYNISTNTVNGIQFSGSGILDPANGLTQTIQLSANGTPITGSPDAFSYTFIYPNGGTTVTCSFPVTFTGDYIIANIDGVFTTFNMGADASLQSTGGVTTYTVHGRAEDNGYPELTIELSLTPTIVPGTYVVNTVNAPTSLKCTYQIAATSSIYSVQSATGATFPLTDPPFIFTIIDNTVRNKGDFNGTLYMNGDLTSSSRVFIQNGHFNLP